MPSPEAQAVWTFIAGDHPYTSWDFWPGRKKYYPGRDPHGAFLTTYVDREAFASINTRTGMAVNSMIVTENYGPDMNLIAITVMYKVQGYDPERGDWFWAEYDHDGKVAVSGKVELCIDCHGRKKENDYIMTAPVKQF